MTRSVGTASKVASQRKNEPKRFQIMNSFGTLASAVLFALSFAASAQMSIEELIEQAGLQTSATATRDLARWSKPKKVVVRAGALDLDAMRQEYPGITFVAVSSPRETLAEVKDAEIIIGDCDQRILAASDTLVWVQSIRAGVERCVGSPQISSGRVLLSNSQKIDSPAIAEHAVAMMMSLARTLPRYVRAMDTGAWLRSQESRARMTTLAGRKLLVVGLGGIGTEVARLGNALGMRVSGTRNRSRSGPAFVEYVGLSDELHTLAADADFIVSALPLTEATTNLFDKAFFEVLKPTARFINIGRGKSVVTDDLVAALKAGKLAGVGLDVTEPEPLPKDHALWQLKNVVITPHLSSAGGNQERDRLFLQENLRRYVAGEALLNVVDPGKGY